MLADVGGLQRALISGISILLSVLNYNFLDGYLVSRLFKTDSIALTAYSMCEGIQVYCIGLLPRKLVCCKKKSKQVAMEKARAALRKEVDIVRLIRSRRFFHMAFKHLLDP